MYRAKTFDEALAKAEQLVADGGYGHTSSLYIHPSQTEKIEKHQQAMKTCRILINTPSSQGGIGDLYNFGLAPSLTLGCGSWGKKILEQIRGTITGLSLFFPEGSTDVAVSAYNDNMINRSLNYVVADLINCENRIRLRFAHLLLSE